MLGKLLPKEGNFFELFNEHADQIVAAAQAFTQLVANYANPELRAKYAEGVDRAEHAADRVTHEVNRQIHTTFITPIDRDQIHALINTMDDVADLLQDSAETMALYDVRQTNEEIERLTDLSLKCCERVRDAVRLLPKLKLQATVEAALKTYVPTGKLDEYYIFASGGQSGNVDVIGVPSMRMLKVIGVFTKERSPLMPDIPTMKESGYPDFETWVWSSFFVRAETPRNWEVYLGYLDGKTPPPPSPSRNRPRKTPPPFNPGWPKPSRHSLPSRRKIPKRFPPLPKNPAPNSPRCSTSLRLPPPSAMKCKRNSAPRLKAPPRSVPG